MVNGKALFGGVGDLQCYTVHRSDGQTEIKRIPMFLFQEVSMSGIISRIDRTGYQPSWARKVTKGAHLQLT